MLGESGFYSVFTERSTFDANPMNSGVGMYSEDPAKASAFAQRSASIFERPSRLLRLVKALLRYGAFLLSISHISFAGVKIELLHAR
jgi:hypothetical protein